MRFLNKLKPFLSTNRRRYFLNLIAFYFTYTWFKSFTYSVLNPHYLQQGLTQHQIIFGDTLYFIAAILLILILKHIYSRKSWQLALITSIIAIFLITRIHSPYQLYLAGIVGGLSIIFFYIPYNIVHFQLTPKHRTGISSGILFSIDPFIGLIAPLIAGITANLNYQYVWILAVAFFLISYIVSQKQYNFPVKFKIDLKQIKPTLAILFLGSLWDPLVFSIIPVFSLFFIKSPLKYGIYISYLSLMSIIANLTLGKLTDKLQKRVVFLYPLSLILALITFLFPLGLKKIIYWIIITGLIRFFTPLFYTLTNSIFIDTTKNLEASMVTKELVLSIGRTLGYLLIVLNFFLQAKPTYIFYFFGTVMLLFPIMLFYNTKISKRYNYL